MTEAVAEDKVAKAEVVIHFGVLGCAFRSPRLIRALCNFGIRGVKGDKRFTKDLGKVTCKRCKKY